MKMSTRNFSEFSLRRLLLQGARAARGSPQLGTRLCDTADRSSSKHDKSHAASSSTSSSATNKNADATSQHSTGTASAPANSATSQQQQSQQQQQNQQRVTSPQRVGSSGLECPLCYNNGPMDTFYTLITCKHIACRKCLESYLSIEILESRTDIACPQCADSMHPSDIKTILLNNIEIVRKYEDFMVRRVLLTDPDARWCPGPDCSYAVIASGCASCPKIKCERPGCDVNFCYHCKAEWHPDQTCDAARASRKSPTRAPSGTSSQDSQHRDDIKACPRCQVLIVKMDDGSCNHMVCTVCGSEFCWLCMKVISDLHYLSPSGCTFWGKKPWSRKKKLLWQLGTLIGAPVGIALVAGIAVPAMIIGIPVWVGKKIHTRYRQTGKHKRNCAVLGGVAASVLVSPVLAGLAVAIGVPILLFYVYGVVPVSLCRAGCGVSTTRDGFKFDFDEEEDIGSRHQVDASSVDAVSRIGATSIGEVSLSVASGSHLGVSSSIGPNPAFGAIALQGTSNRESTTALAGSITGHRLEVQADISTSETASAVTCVSEKSGNTLNDTESTRALAGSILSYKQNADSSNISEDGVSGRVRYVYQIENRNNNLSSSDGWSTVPLDHEIGADKASLGSGQSFRDELDTSSLSSIHSKRTFGIQSQQQQQRMPKLNSLSQHRNMSSMDSTTTNCCIPEQESPSTPPTPSCHEHELNVSVSSSNEKCSPPVPIVSNATTTLAKNKSEEKLNNQMTPTTISTISSNDLALGGSRLAEVSRTTTTTPVATTSSAAIVATAVPISSKPSKTLNSAAILRNLFFSQNPDGFKP